MSGLVDVPQEEFDLIVKQVRSPGCSSVPDWLQDLFDNGGTMRLEELLIQAGRHFSDSLNPKVIPGSGSRRKKATILAWYILAILNPTVESRKLFLDPPEDQDMKRLGSEIIGVGAGLKLLLTYSNIDGRTLKKISNRFDFEAIEKNGNRNLKIELKGTIDDATPRHVSSIREKMSKQKLTSYSRGIGIIFSGWTKKKKRTFDIKIVDPVGKPNFNKDKALREAIRFYARRYDEAIQMENVSEKLWQLAMVPKEISSLSDVTQWLSRRPESQEHESYLSRSSLTLEGIGWNAEFWGGYWTGDVVLPPVGRANSQEYPFAYVGVDSMVMSHLRACRFDNFLDFKGLSGYFKFNGLDSHSGDCEKDIEIKGILYAESNGSIRAWISRVPLGTIVIKDSSS